MLGTASAPSTKGDLDDLVGRSWVPASLWLKVGYPINLRHHVNIHLGLTPILSLLAGILILAMPKLLNFIVAIYLIVIGLIGLFGAGALRLS